VAPYGVADTKIEYVNHMQSSNRCKWTQLRRRQGS